LGRREGISAPEPTIIRHPVEAMSNRNTGESLIDGRVIFECKISSYFGWGVLGLNLLLSWWKVQGPSLLTSVQFAESDLALNALERTRLQPALEQSRALQTWLRTGAGGRLDVPIPVLHPLGNGFVVGVSVGGVRLSGKPNVGLIVCESTEFSHEARQRAKSYDLMVAGSTWNREILEHSGLGPAVVVFQGVDPSHFHPGPRAGWFGDRFTVFSGGKLEFRKAQDLVLLAFRVFAQRHPEALLVTAWSSPFPQFARSVEVNQAIGPVCFQSNGKVDAKAWAVANGIAAEQVLDLGAVPNAELPHLYREMDVALFPNRCEGGTNLVAMECMACGVPLVISNNTGHLDLIASDRCISLVRQNAIPGADHLGWGESDIEEILEGLEAVWRDPAAARALASRAAEFMTRLTWDETARRLAEVLEPYRTPARIKQDIAQRSSQPDAAQDRLTGSTFRRSRRVAAGPTSGRNLASSRFHTASNGPNPEACAAGMELQK
jgi:glycosyltransferase involved in cell wall biosynthesis